MVHPGVSAQQHSQGFRRRFTSIVWESGTSKLAVVIARAVSFLLKGRNDLFRKKFITQLCCRHGRFKATEIQDKTNTFNSIEAISLGLTTLLLARLPPIGSEST